MKRVLANFSLFIWDSGRADVHTDGLLTDGTSYLNHTDWHIILHVFIMYMVHWRMWAGYTGAVVTQL